MFNVKVQVVSTVIKTEVSDQRGRTLSSPQDCYFYHPIISVIISHETHKTKIDCVLNLGTTMKEKFLNLIPSMHADFLRNGWGSCLMRRKGA